MNEEVKDILAKVGSGDVDIYRLRRMPRTDNETEAARVLEQMYNEIAFENDFDLTYGDDFDMVEEMVIEQLYNEDKGCAVN